MFFDITVCIGIMAITPMIAIFFQIGSYALYQRSKHPKEKKFESASKAINVATVVTLALYVALPFAISKSDILGYNHHWVWYVGCMLCGIIGFGIFTFSIFAKGRAELRKHPILVFPWTLITGVGLICIVLSS